MEVRLLNADGPPGTHPWGTRWGAILRGVSTREYEEVLPEMAQTVGVSRSSVSREAVQASAEQLKSLREKRWDTIEILALPSPCPPLWNLLSWTG